MASNSMLETFDPAVESVDDYKEHFDFHCTATGVRQDRQKALFLSRVGREVFAKVKTLASPRSLADLGLPQIMELMQEHYKKDTIEIAERFKFFKRVQLDQETLANYLAELRKLAKHCNFGNYLDTALRDQLVCGLRDRKTQRELLCTPNLTLAMASEKARATETATRETQQLNPSPATTHNLAQRGVGKECHRCGKVGHTADSCIHKDKRCHYCKKVGHLTSACFKKKSEQKALKKDKRSKPRKAHMVDADATESDEEAFDTSHNHIHHNGCHGRSKKLTTTLLLNNVEIQMEVDTGAELSTIPYVIYKEKLNNVKLEPSTISLRQYDGTPLSVRGEITLKVQKAEQSLSGRFVVVDNVRNQLPLLGRDWLRRVRLDWTNLLSGTQMKSINMVNVESIREEFPEVFKEELGMLKGLEAEIELQPGVSSKICKPRPVPFSLRSQVEQTLKQQIDDGELLPVDRSDWATPIVVVTRKDGKLRICADFKVTINPHLKVPTYPLPTPDEVFATLANGESFTKLDLSRAYKQMKVADSSQGYLTITTHMGLFRYQRLPFGIASAPAIWQRAMSIVLQGCSGVVCYLDDLLVTGPTRDVHIQNLRQVLSRLQKFNLRLNASKCKFFQASVEYLGHLVTPSGISPTQERVKGVTEAPPPKNKSELKSFLGMITFNAKFLPSLSTMLHPLYKLLRKDTHWKWTNACQQAFFKAKTAVSQAPVLAHYDVTKPIKLYCDASPYGLGACLMHVIDGTEQPVAYTSRTLSQAETNYAQLEREALAIIFGVKKFNQYLYGREFTLVTDHQPLCKLFGHKEGVRPLAAARMQRWTLILSAYAYKIEFTPGSTNQCADCLSRLPQPSTAIHPAEKGNEVHAMSIDNLPVTAKSIAAQTSKDTVLSKVSAYIRYGSWPSLTPDEVKPFLRRKLELTIVDGCILWGKRVIIPKQLRAQLLKELHVGHVGVCRMKALARSHIWWPGLDDDIETLSSQCEACKTTAAMPVPAAQHPWQYPNAPWERIHIDYGEWNKTNLLVLVDAFSKWPEVKRMSSTTTQKTIEALNDIFATHGFPAILVSDNGPQFTSSEFKEYLQGNNIIHYKSPPYHPASNGLAENMVKNVKHHLKKEAPTTKSGIKHSITTFLTTYRNIPHTVTNQAPADLILKQMPRTKLSLTSPNVTLRVKTDLQSKSRQPAAKTREFGVSDPVLVRDLRPGPHAKWQKGTVTAALGGPRYLVNVGGEHTREAHVDHLLPGVSAEQTLAEPTTDATDNSEQLTDNSPIPPPRRSRRGKVQPKRLVEET